MGIAKVASTQVAKSGFKIALKLVGVALLKEVTQEFVQPYVNQFIDMTLVEGMNKGIKEGVLKGVKEWLRGIGIVGRMLAIDVWKKTLQYKTIIINTVKELIFDNATTPEWQQISVGVLKRIANKNVFTKLLSEIGTVAYDLLSVLPGLGAKLEAKLLEKHLAQIENDEKSKGKIMEQKTTEVQAIKEVKAFTYDEVIDGVSETITSKISSSVTQNIVRPYTSQAVNWGIDKLYGKINDKVEKQLENVKAERRIHFAQNRDPTNRLPKKFKKPSKEDLVAAQADIDAFESGSMAGIQHMGSAADAIKKPIKLVDEKGRTIGIFGSENGGEPVEVQHHPPTKGKPKGHFTLPDGTDPPQKFKNNTENDCLFNVLASQTGESDPIKIRQDAADAMNKNIDYQAMQHNDVQRLKYFKPKRLREGAFTEINRERIEDVDDYLKKQVVPIELSGTYDELNDKYKNHGPVEFNHVPPKDIYKTKRRDEIDGGDLVCMVIAASDHTKSTDFKGMTTVSVNSSRFGRVTQTYNSLLKKLMGNSDENTKEFNQADFANTIIPELIDLQLTSMINNSCNYKKNMSSYLELCFEKKLITSIDKDRIQKIVETFPSLNDLNDTTKRTKIINDFKTKANAELKILDQKIRDSNIGIFSKNATVENSFNSENPPTLTGLLGEKFKILETPPTDTNLVKTQLQEGSKSLLTEIVKPTTIGTKRPRVQKEDPSPETRKRPPGA